MIMKIVSAKDAVEIIQNDWCIVTGGFGSCGHPDGLTQALRRRFISTGWPRNLKLLFAAGSGDRQGRGLDALAMDGLVCTAIGGFWGLCPSLVKMARQGRIEAHNWPQGVISKMFSAVAARVPGIVSTVGMGTFVDPRLDGGVIDTANSQPLVELLTLNGREYLFYPSQRVDCALLRGTAADADGNISMYEETSHMDALAQAQAAKNSGGKVVVQVKFLVDRRVMEPSQIRIPGFLVDYVVLASEEEHPQTYGKVFDASYTSRFALPQLDVTNDVPLAKRIIADRAVLELAKHRGAIVNLGIGIPAFIGSRADALKMNDYTLTVESGLIGGVPDKGLSFGASMNPWAVIEQAAMFDFYDGGGLDVAFLGFGEVDARGNVNVSKLGEEMPGSGGFINISQAAKKVVFCGTLTTKDLEVAFDQNILRILHEGRIQKFLPHVSHLTFNGASAAAAGKELLYVTERAVFNLREGHLCLTEIAPGITIPELRRAIGCDFVVSDDLSEMETFIPSLDFAVKQSSPRAVDSPDTLGVV
jgi:propionate CoA-transferase